MIRRSKDKVWPLRFVTFSPFLITIELTPAEAARLSCGESKCSKNVNDPNLFAFPAQPGTRRVEQKETIFPLLFYYFHLLLIMHNQKIINRITLGIVTLPYALLSGYCSDAWGHDLVGGDLMTHHPLVTCSLTFPKSSLWLSRSDKVLLRLC